jgi:hypothetical protein
VERADQLARVGEGSIQLVGARERMLVAGIALSAGPPRS